MIRGTLDRLHLGDLLQWFQMGALSGRLTLTQNHRERRVDFIDGKISYVSSLFPHERLATWFAKEGLLPPERLQYLLGVSLLRRTLFTNLITEDNELDTEELRRSLTRLGETIVSRLLFARQLDFVFDPAYPVHDLLNLSMNVDPHSLLMEAARRSDELTLEAGSEADDPLPHTGEAFDRFFWNIIREGVTGDELLDGEQIGELYQLVRNIMRTMAQWIASSPGLIPIPEVQADEIEGFLVNAQKVPLTGSPHAVWNQLVLCSSVRSSAIEGTLRFDALEECGERLGLWQEMVTGENWRRPHVGRLDQLTRDEARLWAKTSAAAGQAFGVDPQTAILAAHLMTVPCDLVLWVLSTLQVPHLRLRLTLLKELPIRLGAELASVADFPEAFRTLLSGQDNSPLAACLHIGRQFLESPQLWPETIDPEGEGLAGVFSKSKIKKATALAKKAAQTNDDD